MMMTLKMMTLMIKEKVKATKEDEAETEGHMSWHCFSQGLTCQVSNL
jgi:hypothetical protein